jgi:hypothetical protein
MIDLFIHINACVRDFFEWKIIRLFFHLLVTWPEKWHSSVRKHRLTIYFEIKAFLIIETFCSLLFHANTPATL